MVLQVFLGGFLASIAWFFAGSVLYMNPLIAGVYKRFSKSPGVKRWRNTRKYLISMYSVILMQCLIIALAYSLIKPILLGTLWFNTLFFGLILLGVKVITRLSDMWIQTTYPNKLLLIELINGTIGSFVITLVLALTI